MARAGSSSSISGHSAPMSAARSRSRPIDLRALRRGTDQLDLVTLATDPGRHAFAHPGRRHVPDLVGDALEVLDVDGGDDVESGGEDIHDILPALVEPAGSRNVRVGELVDESDLWPSAEHGVEVHLLQAASPVVHHLPGDDLEAVDQLLGEPPPVALDEPDDHVGAPPPAALALIEHRVGLADARGRAQVDAEMARLLDDLGGVRLR